MPSQPENDTETLLVMLQSLLEGIEVSDEVLLDALLEANGDVDAAARFLKGEGSSTRHTSSSKKRKAVSLTKWLKTPANNETPPRKRKRTESKRASSVDASTSQVPGTPPPSTTKPMSFDASRRKALESPSTPKRFITDVLKPPPSSKPTAPRLPPLTLGTASLVAEHTPSTLHTSILPAELACRLFYRLLDQSDGWQRNKWFIADRLVESPHLTTFFYRDELSKEWEESTKYWYNGSGSQGPQKFPPELEEACTYVEKVVNEELGKRKRYALEWGGESGWRANVAGSNRYKGGNEGVGFHSDMVTHLGPYCTIASLSLGTERIFRLRETIPKDERDNRSGRTYNIPLPHNSLIIMHASCQEHFKHSIPILSSSGIDAFKPPFPRDGTADGSIESHNERINVTFRFNRPDFAPSTIPKCKCGIPATLRAQQKASGRRSVEAGVVEMRYLWMCNSGTVTEGKTCGFVQVLDMDKEGRGPTLGLRSAGGVSDR